MDCGNNIGLVTQQGPTQRKKKKSILKQTDFPYKAKKLFGLEDKKYDKK